MFEQLGLRVVCRNTHTVSSHKSPIKTIHWPMQDHSLSGDVCSTRFFLLFGFVLSSEHKRKANRCKKPCHNVVFLCCSQSWPFVRETTETQCFWPGWALPMSSGGFTWETCIPLLVTCPATFWLCTKKGQNLVTAQGAAWQKDKVTNRQPSEVVRSEPAGWGCSVCQRLQLWIQHHRLSSHTSDWWDWTNPLVCNLPWLR